MIKISNSANASTASVAVGASAPSNPLQQLTQSSSATSASAPTNASAPPFYPKAAAFQSSHQYINPPLAPRFLALNNANQSSSTNANNGTRSAFNTFAAQALKSASANISLTQASATQQSQSTSGNSLQSFLASRNICLNTLAQQQQQQQQANTSNLIASLAAATGNSTFTSQALPTGTLNNTLFVGNLHASLQEIDLIQVFRPFGRIVECCKKWLHFGFVKFSTEEEACHAYLTLNGFRLKGRPMRLEFQNRTKKARIKAILAQAALQSSKCQSNENDEAILFGTSANANIQSPLNALLMNSRAAIYNSGTSEQAYGNNPIANSKYNTMAGRSEALATDFSFFDTEKLLKFATGYEIEDHKLPSYVESAWNSIDIKEHESNSNRLVTSDTSKLWLMDDLSVGISVNNIISPAISPSNDDISTSSSSCISRSSDSGCRSHSFYADDDSVALKPSLTKITAAFDSHVYDIQAEQSISEHLEFTYSHTTHTDSMLKQKQAAAAQKNASLKKISVQKNDSDDEDGDNDDAKSYISSSDTSDDASIIHEEDDDIDELSVTYSDEMKFEQHQNKAAVTMPVIGDRDAQEMDDHTKSKLEFGVYSCLNDTKSFFIEPEDVLKPLDDFKEYRLFPSFDAARCGDTYISLFF